MNTSALQISKIIQSTRKWKTRLSPIFGVAVVTLFLYWIWVYRDIILATFKKVNGTQLATLVFFTVVTSILTAYALVILVRDKKYDFKFTDGYHSLNMSQLASMIPGGIWGFAGFAGFLWSKGVSKIDSVVIIFVHTLAMLSACAIVGISGLITILGWGYAIICLLPFFLLFLGRDWLDNIRQKFYPESSKLPSTSALSKVLFWGIIIWIIKSSCFAWLLYISTGNCIAPFWTVIGAYTTGYLGGYISILVPSGLGVSEGLVTLMLSPYADTSRILAVAISFRIIHVFIMWCNIVLSILLTSKVVRKRNH